MLKRFLAVTALAFAAATTSGCAEVKALFQGGPTIEEAKAVIAKVKEGTAKVCKFEPLDSVVANIVAAGSPALGTVNAIVDAICAAVAPKASVDAGKPTVAGVVIEGRRVN